MPKWKKKKKYIYVHPHTSEGLAQIQDYDFIPVYTSHILIRPLFNPVARSSWSCPNLNRCHSIFTQRLCFSGTEDPKARLQTISPQSIICSRGLFFWPPSLFCLDNLKLLELVIFLVPCKRLVKKKRPDCHLVIIYSGLLWILNNKCLLK